MYFVLFDPTIPKEGYSFLILTGFYGYDAYVLSNAFLYRIERSILGYDRYDGDNRPSVYDVVLDCETELRPYRQRSEISYIKMKGEALLDHIAELEEIFELNRDNAKIRE
ncbi:MAG: hypothetical protein K2G58_04360, partial [Alistipes sp.]|nr:hypothetical protein [Alistipes sp.]